MTTVVNNPSGQSESGGYGFFLGVIALVVFGIIFIYFGIPAFRQMGTPQITVPTEVQMPDKIDVNVNN